MNIFLILFIIAILISAVGGPVIDSTSGADIIDKIAVIVSNVSGFAAIVLGIIGVIIPWTLIRRARKKQNQ